MAIVQDMDAEGLHASPLIIRLIIQTIRLDLWIDDPSNLSRADPSGADQGGVPGRVEKWNGRRLPTELTTLTGGLRPCRHEYRLWSASAPRSMSCSRPSRTSAGS